MTVNDEAPDPAPEDGELGRCKAQITRLLAELEQERAKLRRALLLVREAEEALR